MKRGYLYVVLVAMVACGSAGTTPHRTAPLPQSTMSVTSPSNGTASASLSASASPASSATVPSRPAVTPALSEVEAMLRDICPVQYVLTSGVLTAVGCSNCLAEGEYEANSFSVLNDEPGDWMVSSLLRGAFSGPGQDEAFLRLAGGCNPKHTGLALLSKEADHWSVTFQTPAKDTRTCRVVGRPDKHDVIVCDVASQYPSGSQDALFVMDQQDGKASAELIVFHHPSETSYSPPPPRGTLTDASIAGFQIVDANHDGLVDIVVTVEVRQAGASEVFEDEAFSWSRKPVIRQESLQFDQTPSGFTPTSATRRQLAAWTRLLPKN